MEAPDLTVPDCEVEEVEEETQSIEDKKRLELIKLSEKGEITQSVKYIKKASNKVVNKLHSEWLYMQQDKTNEILADVLIVKFAELMGMLDTVA